MIKWRVFMVLICLCLAVSFAEAKGKKDKSQASIILFWPNQDSPSLKLTFGPFVQLAVDHGQLSLQSNVLIENLSQKSIPQASFSVYLLDPNKVRIGSRTLNISDLNIGEQVRLSFQVFSIGPPASLSLVAHNNGGLPTSMRTVPVKVISVPVGASLKVDGRDAGVTPAVVNLTVGDHILEFSKDGYASGSTPVDIKPDESPGGSITFELGGLSRDSVELRDGTVLPCDVVSLSLSSVVVRVDGKEQTFDRNQVRKILLVEREVQPAVTQPTQR
jgi:hypothetical protein